MIVSPSQTGLRGVVCLAIGLVLVGATTARDDSRPNVVVLFADDMGFSDVGCFGSEIETPNIDRLAADGVRFSHFYQHGTLLPLACVDPDRTLSASSRHRPHGGRSAGAGYRDRLSRNAVTLAEVLGAAGYHTIMTGKWHLGWREDGAPTSRGFQHFYGTRGYIDSYFTIVPRTEVYLGDEIVLPSVSIPSTTSGPIRRGTRPMSSPIMPSISSIRCERRMTDRSFSTSPTTRPIFRSTPGLKRLESIAAAIATGGRRCVSGVMREWSILGFWTRPGRCRLWTFRTGNRCRKASVTTLTSKWHCSPRSLTVLIKTWAESSTTCRKWVSWKIR